MIRQPFACRASHRTVRDGFYPLFCVPRKEDRAWTVMTVIYHLYTYPGPYSASLHSCSRWGLTGHCTTATWDAHQQSHPRAWTRRIQGAVSERNRAPPKKDSSRDCFHTQWPWSKMLQICEQTGEPATIALTSCFSPLPSAGHWGLGNCFLSPLAVRNHVFRN